MAKLAYDLVLVFLDLRDDSHPITLHVIIVLLLLWLVVVVMMVNASSGVIQRLMRSAQVVGEKRGRGSEILIVACGCLG